MNRASARRSIIRASPRKSGIRLAAAWLLSMVVALVVCYGVVTMRIDFPPRSLAPYIEHRTSQHLSLIASGGRWLANLLIRLDRGEDEGCHTCPALRRIGVPVNATASDPPVTGAVLQVSTSDQMLAAINGAHPGDVITLDPGSYLVESPIEARNPGRSEARITVRATKPHTVTVNVRAVQGFVVAAPYWTFENLTIRGDCAISGACEHAFHVVGAATHFVARHNDLVDFNAHIKVNGESRFFPDNGLIEDNTIQDTKPRETDSPVTPIDIVAASHWTIRGNLISDFIKAQGDRISYGAFAKGGGSGNRFEGNVVVCENAMRGRPGWRVGLSLGGGGTRGGSGEFCRDRTCVIEQDEGTIEANLIASCSDDGIYVNRSASTRVVHNTLVDTGGIVVRFAESSADVSGNLVDGAIRSRDSGLIHATENLQTSMGALYVGRHPLRSLFRDASVLDLRWRDKAPRVPVSAPPSVDLCGVGRPVAPAYGAFEDFAKCLDAVTNASPVRTPAR